MAMTYTIERPIGEVAWRDKIVDIVTSRAQFSESYFSGVRHRLPRLYDLWRGVWTGRFHPHKNNVHIPLIYSAIWADAARKGSTSLSMWPAVMFQGYGPSDRPIAQKWESLISAQMKDNDTFMKEVDTFVTADLYGVAITQLGWKRYEPMRIIEAIDRLPLSDKIVRTIRKGKVIMFDGPESESVDRLDASPQPGIRRPSDMKWFIRRKFVDIDDLWALAEAGMFDKSELKRLQMEGGVNSGLATDIASIKRFQVRTGMDDESARWMDRYSRPVEILEMWGEIPSELAQDGVLSRVITIANRRYVLRNKPNPFWHGRLPFCVYTPTPDPHYFDAPGKAEIMEKIQIVANRYINQSLDASDIQIDPAWFYDRAANLNTRNLFLKPGRFIPVDGNPNDVVASLQGNMQGITIADTRVNLMRDLGQMGSGLVEDAVQGLQGPDRQTAREFIGRREAAGTRLALESRIYEEMYLEKFANMMVALDKQFLDMPAEVMILGDNAIINSDTGEPIPVARETLTEYDMMPSYSARAIGATTALSKSMKQQNLVQLLTAMSATPEVFGAINLVNFWRGIFREFEIPNINEIFIQNSAMAALVQQATMGQGGIENVPTSGQIAGGQMQMGLPSAPGLQGGGAGLAGSMIPTGVGG